MGVRSGALRCSSRDLILVSRGGVRCEPLQTAVMVEESVRGCREYHERACVCVSI